MSFLNIVYFLIALNLRQFCSKIFRHDIVCLCVPTGNLLTLRSMCCIDVGMYAMLHVFLEVRGHVK